METARNLAITYATLKGMVASRGYSEGLIEALRATYSDYVSLPDDETEGKPIYLYPTNQGGKTRSFSPERDREILEYLQGNAIRKTAKDMGCSVRHIQDIQARQIEETRLKEEDERFWAMVIEKEHAKPKGKSGKGKGKDKTDSEQKSEDKAPDQMPLPGLDWLPR